AAFTWGWILPLLGFWLGGHAWVGEHIDLIIVAIVVVSLIPVLIEYLKHRAERKRAAAEAQGEDQGTAPAAQAASGGRHAA
ncbi:MAG: hypothetical protein LBM66_04190, partial [Bifidobacteriaceae bacterium]|nr:hypothetical protein [Bifidobacteriaceae bacterium]